MFRIATLALAVTLAACATAAKPAPSYWAEANPAWAEPFAPFRIADRVYYVGTRGLSSFLITTDEGHYLIDGGLPENANAIARNIEALGFKPGDVEYLLNSHAHFDHSGGLAALKALTGATMVASDGDKGALETGLVPGSEDDRRYAAPPVEVDRVISDGEALILGDVSLTARITPGHTRGCTSWTMTAAGHDILFFCSATVAANRLANPPQYDGIVADYHATFDRTRDWRPDIFLANHPEFFDMERRRARQIAGEEDAFVDAGAFQTLIEKLEAVFKKALIEQMAADSRE